MKFSMLLKAIGLLSVFMQCSAVAPISLSEYLWQETTQQHQAALGSSFIQGLNTITLDPTNFGAYMVQDAIYCYKVKQYLDIAANRTNDIPLKKFIKDRASSYERYYKGLFSEWHISNPDGILLGNASSGYLNHLNNVTRTMDPIYLVAGLIPCAKLWPWLGGQIGAKTKNFSVYTKWVKENLDPDYHGYGKYERVIDNAFRDGLIDKQTALQVYTRSMQGEVDFFSSV